MPYRNPHLLWGVLGVLVVLALALAGVDARLSATRGPRWKRKLVGSGLALLAMLGLLSCVEPAGNTPGAGEPQSPAGDGHVESSKDAQPAGIREVLAQAGIVLTGDESKLREMPEWRDFVRAWSEAREIVSGRAGAYPFTQKEKSELLQAMKRGVQDLRTLAKAGSMEKEAADILGAEMSALYPRVERVRPVEMKMATCYSPMPAPDLVFQSSAFLRGRLDLLRKLEAEEGVAPAVLGRVIQTLERHLHDLSAPRDGRPLSAGERAEIEKLRAETKELMDRLRADAVSQLTKGDLGGNPKWVRIATLWKETTENLKRVDFLRTFTREKRDALREEIAGLSEEADALEEEGAIGATEAEHLRKAIRRLVERVKSTSATDDPPGPTCYTPTPNPNPPPPVWIHVEFLRARMHILDELAAQQKLHPETLEKILEGYESHLQALSDGTENEGLSREQKEEVRALRARVEALFADIREAEDR